VTAQRNLRPRTASDWLRIGAPALLMFNLILAGCAGGPRPQPTNDQHYRATVVDVARDMLGVPYHYGGESPRQGFDCSGLVYYSYRRAGIDVPRVAGAQYSHTRPVRRDRLRPGDLVFFRIGRRLVSHVGIYIGRGHFIHAPSSGSRVSIANLNDSYWRRHYIRGGRFLVQVSSN